MTIRVAILTISDSCAQGKRADESGPAIRDMLGEKNFEVCEKITLPDDYRAIAKALRHLSDELCIDVILTTGGTGLGRRDVTPEATASVCERMVPGLAEILRSEGFRTVPNAVLSRGVAGTRDSTLIINLPGSPKAVRECLEVILGVLPHAVDMMRGGGH